MAGIQQDHNQMETEQKFMLLRSGVVFLPVNNFKI